MEKKLLSSQTMGSLDDPKKMDPKDLEVYPFQSLSSRGYLSIYIYTLYLLEVLAQLYVDLRNRSDQLVHLVWGNRVPSGYVKIAIENGPFIVDLPIEDGDFP